MNDKKKEAHIAGVKAFGFTALALITTFFNVFGLAERSDADSTSWFYSAYAPFVSDSLKGEPVIVVMYDADQLAELNKMSAAGNATDPADRADAESWTWPLKLVNNLALFDPCAVFFDIGFYQPRGSTRALEEALSSNKEAGQRRCVDAHGDIKTGDGPAPIFFADLISTPANVVSAGVEQKLPQDFPILNKFVAAGVQMVPVKWTSAQNDYPTTVEIDPTDGPKLIETTPAVRLWTAWCKVTRDPRCADMTGRRSEISLAWGVGNHPAQRNFPGGGRCLASRSSAPNEGNGNIYKLEEDVGLSIVRLATQIGITIGVEDEKALQQECPYALTLPASWLAGENKLVDWCPESIDKSLRVEDEGVERCSTYDIMKSYINGRIVLVGANFPGAGDVVPSPVNGLIPGVYYHANATENLLRFGSDFRHKPEGTIGILWDVFQYAVLFGCLYLVLLQEMKLRRLAFTLQKHVREWARPLTYIGATIVTILAIVTAAVVLVSAVVLNTTFLSGGLSLLLLGPVALEPANWLGMSGALSTATSEMIAEIVAAALFSLFFAKVSDTRAGTVTVTSMEYSEMRIGTSAVQMMDQTVVQISGAEHDEEDIDGNYRIGGLTGPGGGSMG